MISLLPNERVIYMKTYYNLIITLLTGILVCACSNHTVVEEPPVRVKPVAPVMNPVDGIWIGDMLDKSDTGQERHLVFNSDFTYQMEVYSATGDYLRTEASGTYEVKNDRLYYEDGNVYKFRIENDCLYMTDSSGGQSVERVYERHFYSDGIVSASRLQLEPKGMLTRQEIDAFKGYMMYNQTLQVPVTPQYEIHGYSGI